MDMGCTRVESVAVALIQPGIDLRPWRCYKGLEDI